MSAAEQKTLLILATKDKDHVLVRKLLGMGADPHVTDMFDKTPLLIAAEGSDLMSVRSASPSCGGPLGSGRRPSLFSNL